MNKRLGFLFLVCVVCVLFGVFGSINNIEANEIPEGAIKIDVTDDSSKYYTITQGGDYVLEGTDGKRGIEFILDNPEESTPTRIYITQNMDMNPQEAVFYIKKGGAFEIIGVGEEPIVINTITGKNFLACASDENLSIKMRNIVIKNKATVSAQNQFIVKATGGANQNIELTDVVYEDWYSDPGHSSFVMALISDSGKMTATLNNCKFINNEGHSGGGVMLQGNENNPAEIVFNNCNLDGNMNNKENLSPNVAAGSINVRKYSTVTLNQCEVKNGKITGVSSTGEPLAGGVSVAENGKLILKDTHISGNQGDGIYNEGEIVVKGNNKIINNERYGVYNVSNSKVLMEGVLTFENNGMQDMLTEPSAQIIDTTSPVIDGIEDEELYCGTVNFKISEMYLDKVFIDNIEQQLNSDGSYKIDGDDRLHEVIAVDKSNNRTSLRITVNKGHTWKQPVFEWAADYSNVSARFECAVDVLHTQNEPCKLEVQGTEEKIYTASVILDGKTYTDVKKVKNDINQDDKDSSTDDDKLDDNGENIDKNTNNQEELPKKDIEDKETLKDLDKTNKTPSTYDENNIYIYLLTGIFTVITMVFVKRIMCRK